ncbi:hypothetical protein Lal_00026805 [Lupinus albus]|nr:hypothetical protein Lal_00026805 [Lupinus albus]
MQPHNGALSGRSSALDAKTSALNDGSDADLGALDVGSDVEPNAKLGALDDGSDAESGALDVGSGYLAKTHQKPKSAQSGCLAIAHQDESQDRKHGFPPHYKKPNNINNMITSNEKDDQHSRSNKDVFTFAQQKAILNMIKEPGNHQVNQLSNQITNVDSMNPDNYEILACTIRSKGWVLDKIHTFSITVHKLKTYPYLGECWVWVLGNFSSSTDTASNFRIFPHPTI